MTRPATAAKRSRRLPLQGGSAARVQRIVDICGVLVDEIGYDRLSTTVIAERARIPVGALYQFFPDKQAVVRALQRHRLRVYAQRLAERFTGDNLAHWLDGASAGIDERIHLHRTLPGFRVLHLSQVASAQVLDGESTGDDAIAAQLTRALIQRFAIADTAHLRSTMGIAVTASNARWSRSPSADSRAATSRCSPELRPWSSITLTAV